MKKINNIASLKSLIYLMRFGTNNINHNNKPILNLKTIAETLKLSNIQSETTNKSTT